MLGNFDSVNQSWLKILLLHNNTSNTIVNVHPERIYNYLINISRTSSMFLAKFRSCFSLILHNTSACCRLLSLPTRAPTVRDFSHFKTLERAFNKQVFYGSLLSLLQFVFYHSSAVHISIKWTSFILWSTGRLVQYCQHTYNSGFMSILTW
jgi:hypothetical protein